MGKPPWMRQTRVTADGETEFHDTGFPTSFLSIFIGLSMPRNPRKAFSMHRAVWWTVAWLALFAAFTAIQAWYTFQTRDSARMGEWYLHMFGITLRATGGRSRFCPCCLAPGASCYGYWAASSTIGPGSSPSPMFSSCNSSSAHWALHRTLRHVSDVRSACAGTDRFDHRPRSRAAVCLQLTADMDSRSHHRRHRLTLAVNMAAVTGASSARQNGTAMNRLRIIAYVLSCLGFVALLIAICIVLAFLRNKQTNILLAVLAFLTLIAWIPGEMKSIRRCVAEQRDASWQCVAGSFLAFGPDIRADASRHRPHLMVTDMRQSGPHPAKVPSEHA